MHNLRIHALQNYQLSTLLKWAFYFNSVKHSCSFSIRKWSCKVLPVGWAGGSYYWCSGCYDGLTLPLMLNCIDSIVSVSKCVWFNCMDSKCVCWWGWCRAVTSLQCYIVPSCGYEQTLCADLQNGDHVSSHWAHIESVVTV